MKKLISVCLLLALLATMPITVFAFSAKASYTASSSFRVGGTATIDIMATCAAVMQDPSVTADLYNAALERLVSYQWSNTTGEIQKNGQSVTWSEQDVGKEFYCQVRFFYNDELVGTVETQPRLIEGNAPPQNANINEQGTFLLTVGQPWQMQLSCNVSGVTFEEFRTSLPKGMQLSKSGLISGTPTTPTGDTPCYVTIAVYKDGEMIGDGGFEFYVYPAQSVSAPEITTETLPEARVGEAYSVKLACTDADAVFSEDYIPDQKNQLKETGLFISQHGELTGTPTAAGTYTFSIQASGEGGKDTVQYTLTVKAAQEATQPSTEATEQTQGATKPTKAPSGATQPTQAPEKTDSNGNADNGATNIWLYVGIGLGVAILAVVVVVVILRKPKKRPEDR